MLSEEQVYTIETLMPLVRRWALQFISKKKGHPVSDPDDYVQAAYVGLVKYVNEKGCANINYGLLRLYTKREMFLYAHSTLGVSIPINDFMSMSIDVAASLDSIEALYEAVNDAFMGKVSTASGAVLGTKSSLSTDERIDLRDVSGKIPERLRKVYKLMRKGDSITGIAEHLGMSYTTAYEEVARVRSILKEYARPDFLIPSTSKTERIVSRYKEKTS